MITAEDFKNLISFANPGDSFSLEEVAAQVTNFLLLLAGIIAVIFLIYAGILYITAGNKPEQAQKAQQAVINVVIGIIVISLAYVIIRVVQQAATGIIQ